MNDIDATLKQLGISLPVPAAPVANYVAFVRSGNLLIISGQLPFGPDGQLAERHKGKLGVNVFHEAGQEAAQLCAINILAQAKLALGSLNKITRCLKLNGFINCAPGFHAFAPVMNGASDLMVKVLGDAGRHARAAVGVAELPLNAAVEVDAMFEISE